MDWRPNHGIAFLLFRKLQMLYEAPKNRCLSRTQWIGFVALAGCSGTFYTADVQNLGVIHRGFSPTKKPNTATIPNGRLPSIWQNRFPDLPLFWILAGRRTSFRSLPNGFGPSITTGWWSKPITIRPCLEWCRPTNYPSYLKTNDHRFKDSEGRGRCGEFNNKLGTLRTKIDVIDHQLIEMLGKRMKIADAIGELKRSNNVISFNPNVGTKFWAGWFWRWRPPFKRRIYSAHF